MAREVIKISFIPQTARRAAALAQRAFQILQSTICITEDYERAAELFNLCRAKGVQGSNTDFLICAVAERNNCNLFTTDKDFQLYSKYIPVKLHHVQIE